MYKKSIICILLLICTNLYSENVKVKKNNEFNGKTVETVYTANDEDSKKFDKKVEYYDKAGKVKKLEYYYSKDVIDKTDISAQFQYYNEDEVIYCYEMFFPKKAVDRSNIDRILEFVDAEDNVTKIEYYSRSKLVSVETEKFHMFAFIKFKNHAEVVKDSYNEHLKKGFKTDFYIYETAVVRGKAITVYQNRIEDIADKEFQFLINYSKMTKDTALENYIRTLYKKKILVKEGDTLCWVFMQDSLIPYIKENQVMVFKYYFFGSINDMPVFVAVGYEEL